jgi:hypothetical protein
MISCQFCWRTMRWHNGPIRRSQNPYPEEVFQDCVTKWEESVAHSILARSLFAPPKAVYICADQPCPSLFRLQFGGGPYIPSADNPDTIWHHRLRRVDSRATRR